MADGPWLSDEQQCAWRAFLQLTGSLTERLDRDLRRDAGLPHTYYLVLAMLSEAPGRSLRMAELASAAWASPSRMSHAVDRLQEAGWVRRRRAAGDRRGQVATLTDEGFERLVAAAPSHAESVRRIMFDRLSPEQLHAFNQVCTLALEQLAEPAQDGGQSGDRNGGQSGDRNGDRQSNRQGSQQGSQQSERHDEP